MPTYRIYSLDKITRKITAPGGTVVLPSDDEAIQAAEQLVDGHIIEVWEGTRRVIHLERGRR